MYGGADIGKREDPGDEASKELYLFHRAVPCGLFPYISNKFIKKIRPNFFGIFGPQFGLNIRGGGGGDRAPLDPPLNRKASGLRCKFATKLITCSPVILSPGTD